MYLRPGCNDKSDELATLNLILLASTEPSPERLFINVLEGVFFIKVFIPPKNLSYIKF